ncbi:MAG TPA: hypothetical protein VF044_07625 [Actinomycetota bacterium]
MTRITALLPMLLALVLLALAGCGIGDDDEGAPTTATTAPSVGDTTGTATGGEALPKDEFIERGDAICSDLQTRAAALGREAQALANVSLDDPNTTKAAARIWHKQVDLVDELKRRFDELGPAPEGQETTVGNFREDITRALALGKQIAGALDRGDDPSALVGDYTTLIDQSNATAGLIGFKVCGQT